MRGLASFRPLATLLCAAAAASPSLSPASRANASRGVGVYRDARRRAAAPGDAARTLLLVSCNAGYARLLRSWMCRARELGCEGWLQEER